MWYEMHGSPSTCCAGCEPGLQPTRGQHTAWMSAPLAAASTAKAAADGGRRRSRLSREISFGAMFRRSDEPRAPVNVVLLSARAVISGNLPPLLAEEHGSKLKDGGQSAGR